MNSSNPWLLSRFLLWLLAPQHGMLKRRLQVRRHAVYDIAIRTLDFLDGGVPDPVELGLDPPERKQLLAGAERHLRAIAAAASGRGRGGEGEGDEEEEGNKGGNDWASADANANTRSHQGGALLELHA
uniref:Uncharacterized protein n=1 Tax=Arundo donax TaxID=35708 RepID=A0A0A8YXD8_ARUDO